MHDRSYVNEEWIEARRAALPGELVEMVRARPGRSKWFYLSLPPAEGGLRGLLAEKELAFRGLVKARQLVRGKHYAGRRGTKGWYPMGYMPTEKAALPLVIGAGEAALRLAILETVRREPGRSQSYYCRLSPARGGLAGSQERKERALAALLAEGLLRLQQLERPLGRQRAGVYPGRQGV